MIETNNDDVAVIVQCKLWFINPGLLWMCQASVTRHLDAIRITTTPPVTTGHHRSLSTASIDFSPSLTSFLQGQWGTPLW